MDLVQMKSVPAMASKAAKMSIRKRKFTQHELSNKDKLCASNLESEYEGQFWFEKSTTTILDAEKIHYGITRRERQLLKEIIKSGFYTQEKITQLVIPLNDENSSTPRLRAYDWAVTNFSKGRPVLQIVDGAIVDPNLDYQNELKKHHRLLFDPFRRGTHLFFEAIPGADATVHRTTVGQLCFIKWCVENKVDKYVENNLEAIREHMCASTKTKRNFKRRRELTSAPKKLLRGAIFETMTLK